jgi:hypothetical protein
MKTSLALTLAILLSAGCMANQDVTTDLPDGWMVTVGSQGGFTGGGSGYQIRANGRVRRWTQLTPQDDIETTRIGSASDESLRELYTAMTAPELRDLQLSQTGNMTAFLDWTMDEDARHYSWPEGPQPPAPVVRAREAAMAAGKEAEGNP